MTEIVKKQILFTGADIFYSLILKGDFAVIAVSAFTCRRLGFESNLYGLAHRQNKHQMQNTFNLWNGEGHFSNILLLKSNFSFQS